MEDHKEQAAAVNRVETKPPKEQITNAEANKSTDVEVKKEKNESIDEHEHRKEQPQAAKDDAKENNEEKNQKLEKEDTDGLPGAGKVEEEGEKDKEAEAEQLKIAGEKVSKMGPRAYVRNEEVDVSLLKVPLDKGWRRQRVERNNSTPAKPLYDVYYFTPGGKKLRSNVDIQKHLDAHPEMQLTTSHFSFNKQVDVPGTEEHSARPVHLKPKRKGDTPNQSDTDGKPSKKRAKSPAAPPGDNPNTVPAEPQKAPKRATKKPKTEPIAIAKKQEENVVPSLPSPTDPVEIALKPPPPLPTMPHITASGRGGWAPAPFPHPGVGAMSQQNANVFFSQFRPTGGRPDLKNFGGPKATWVPTNGSQGKDRPMAPVGMQMMGGFMVAPQLKMAIPKAKNGMHKAVNGEAKGGPTGGKIDKEGKKANTPADGVVVGNVTIEKRGSVDIVMKVEEENGEWEFSDPDTPPPPLPLPCEEHESDSEEE